jgi:hypothetical protein
MTKTAGPIFEFACHEGNYGMQGMLSARPGRKKRLTDSVIKVARGSVLNTEPRTTVSGSRSFWTDEMIRKIS